MRDNRDIKPHKHAPSCTRRVVWVQSWETLEYRGDNTGAEETGGACRYGAHCPGVMAPACSLDVWLPRKSFETRGGPPSLVLCPCVVEEASLGYSTKIRGGPPVLYPPPRQGGAALTRRYSTEIRGGPPVPGSLPTQGGVTLTWRDRTEIRGGPLVPSLRPSRAEQHVLGETVLK